MGWYMTYQALPDDPHWWARVLGDGESRENLGRLPIYVRWGGNAPGAGRLGREADALVRAMPGIEHRHFDLGGWAHSLHHLLSEVEAARRRDPGSDPGGVVDPGEDDDRSDLSTLAIRGARAVTWEGFEVVTGSGIPVCYTPPAAVVRAATFLEGVADSELRELGDPDVPAASGARHGASGERYRIFPEEEWPPTLVLLRGLRRFYWEVAVHGEGVLVCLT